MSDGFLPTPQNIREAAARIHGFVKRTPVMTCSSLNGMCDAELFFKCENLQKVGAFKYRGATNAVRALPDEAAARGVATHSSGNHAAALALAAKVRGIRAYVVMPRTAPAVKQAAVAGYGAEIIECEPTLAARESTLAEVVQRTGAEVVHPYDDPYVIAGQGTAALELLEEVPGLDVVMTPVGGGGLISGTALAAALSSGTRVIAAEPEGADDAYQSMTVGHVVHLSRPQSVCDGLLASLSARTFAIIRERVERIITVADPAILTAMRTFWERTKLIIEPSSAVPLAAILEAPQTKKLDVRGLRVGIILSGGNVDLGSLRW
jgi:threonine dehydratase